MPATSDHLRDYLIKVLQCEGPTLAKDRLALRQQWKLTHRAEGRSDDATRPRKIAVTAADRAQEWAELELLWEQFPDLPPDGGEALRPWLNSGWNDVRQAGNQLQNVLRCREQIVAMWPEELDRALLDLFLAILIRPVARRRELQQELNERLQASPHRQRSFQRFVHSMRRAFPQLAVPDIETERRGQGEPIALVASQTPLITPPKKDPNAAKTAFGWIAISLLIAVIKGFGSMSNHQTPTPTFRPPASNNSYFNPQQPSNPLMPGNNQGLRLPPQLPQKPPAPPPNQAPPGISPSKTLPVDPRNPANGPALRVIR